MRTKRTLLCLSQCVSVVAATTLSMGSATAGTVNQYLWTGPHEDAGRIERLAIVTDANRHSVGEQYSVQLTRRWMDTLQGVTREGLAIEPPEILAVARDTSRTDMDELRGSLGASHLLVLHWTDSLREEHYVETRRVTTETTNGSETTDREIDCAKKTLEVSLYWELLAADSAKFTGADSHSYETSDCDEIGEDQLRVPTPSIVEAHLLDGPQDFEPYIEPTLARISLPFPSHAHLERHEELATRRRWSTLAEELENPTEPLRDSPHYWVVLAGFLANHGDYANAVVALQQAETLGTRSFEAEITQLRARPAELEHLASTLDVTYEATEPLANYPGIQGIIAERNGPEVLPHPDTLAWAETKGNHRRTIDLLSAASRRGSDPVGTLLPGTKVMVEAEDGRFVQVSVPNGHATRGWVPRRTLTELDGE